MKDSHGQPVVPGPSPEEQEGFVIVREADAHDGQRAQNQKPAVAAAWSDAIAIRIAGALRPPSAIVAGGCRAQDETSGSPSSYPSHRTTGTLGYLGYSDLRNDNSHR